LYGGTFDPVHIGHLEIARRVSQLFEIDKVVFIPAQMAPHKIGRPVTPAVHRYAMLALATQNDPQLSISTFELDDPDRRYTVDTVAHFQRTLGDETELFFIMGADSWSEITTWREWERLLTMTNHIVVTRPGYEPALTHVGVVGERIVDLRGGVTKATTSRRTPGIYFADVVMKDVSATRIRQLAGEGRSDELTGLLPTPVLEYIKKYGIYKN
jgi:nicotinate-nucleotide adenylyltransferase